MCERAGSVLFSQIGTISTLGHVEQLLHTSIRVGSRWLKWGGNAEHQHQETSTSTHLYLQLGQGRPPWCDEGIYVAGGGCECARGREIS